MHYDILTGSIVYIISVASILGARGAIAPNKKIPGSECLFAPSMF